MIFNGSEGSLNLFYGGLLISSFALCKKKTFKKYEYMGNKLILDSLKDNISLDNQIPAYIWFCSKLFLLKSEKKSIRRSDHELFVGCLFALIKLKILDDDDENGFFIQPKKKSV
mgnify:FL=1